MFLGAGGVSVFLPIIPGVLLIVIGLYILSIVSPKVKKYFEILKTRFPRITAQLFKIDKKFHSHKYLKSNA